MEEVEIIEEKISNGDKKSSVFKIGEGSSSLSDNMTIGSVENRRFVNCRRRLMKTPKNLYLFEEEPIDLTETPKKREIRIFPNSKLLSSRIKKANGTDYSNYFIEDYYNRHSKIIDRCEKSTNSSGGIELMRRKKTSLEHGRCSSGSQGFGSKHTESQVSKSLIRDSMNLKIVTLRSPDLTFSKKQKTDGILKADKIKNINSNKKLDSNPTNVTKNNVTTLVAYSDSDTELQSDSKNEIEEIREVEEVKVIGEIEGNLLQKTKKIQSSRALSIREGLEDNKFKFRTKNSSKSTSKTRKNFLQK